MAETSMGLNLNLNPSEWFGGSDTAESDRRYMNDWNMKMAERNEKFQHEQFEWNKQLNLHGIKMRADDAIAAGFHPLVGAGVNPAGGHSGGFGGQVVGGDSQKSRRGAGVSVGLSQGIGRAQSATMTQMEREMAQANLEGIRANTAESEARKALAEYELEQLRGKPPFPPLEQQYRDSNGRIVTLPHPDAANAMSADPAYTWYRSLIVNPSRRIRQNWRNDNAFWSREMNKPRRY